MKCPTCNRAIRRKKVETPEDRLKRIHTQAAAGVSKTLRAPMPRGTRYRE